MACFLSPYPLVAIPVRALASPISQVWPMFLHYVKAAQTNFYIAYIVRFGTGLVWWSQALYTADGERAAELFAWYSATVCRYGKGAARGCSAWTWAFDSPVVGCVGMKYEGSPRAVPAAPTLWKSCKLVYQRGASTLHYGTAINIAVSRLSRHSLNGVIAVRWQCIACRWRQIRACLRESSLRTPWC